MSAATSQRQHETFVADESCIAFLIAATSQLRACHVAGLVANVSQDWVDAKEAPQGAKVSDWPNEAKGWVHRMCRHGQETPWTLRQPVDVSGMSRAALRVLSISACAAGNVAPSPFLHTTTPLNHSLYIDSERRHLYNSWLVRWPFNHPAISQYEIDFATGGHHYFNEENGDSHLLQDSIIHSRQFTVKDKEVVYTKQPPFDLIEWWDADANKSWRPSGRDLRQ